MSQLIDSSIARQFDRLPPHSIESEMCLLASMMLDHEMIAPVRGIVSREAFFQADNQVIYDVLCDMVNTTILGVQDQIASDVEPK